MVGKLIKYDVLHFVRKLMPFQLGILLIALVTRIIQFFETDTTAYNISIVSSSIILGVAIFFCMGITVWFTVARFYKNLFSTEGYLSFTLPVTPSQHILSKIITYVIFSFITLLVSVLGVVIATSGDMLAEIYKAISYLVGLYFKQLGTNGVFYAIEFAVFMFIEIVNAMLIFYACVSIGQCAKKSRIGMAVCAYFIYYVITQVFGTVFIILITALSDTELAVWITNFVYSNQYESVHIALCGLIVFELIMGFVYFFISYFVIRRKLNLE